MCTNAFFMLFSMVTSFLSSLIMTFSLCCIFWFILLTVSLEQFCEGQRQTHTNVCRAFSKFVATLLKYLDGTSLFSLHCTSLHFRSQHFKTFFFWLFRQICIILHARNTSKEIACKLKIDFRHISMLRKIFFEVLKVICIIYCRCCAIAVLGNCSRVYQHSKVIKPFTEAIDLIKGIITIASASNLPKI